MVRSTALSYGALIVVACSISPRPAEDAGPADGGDQDAGDTDPGIPGWELAWAVRAGSEGSDLEDCYGGIAALDDGHTLVAGRIAGPSVFGEGTANEIATGYNGGLEDAFLARYDPGGTPVWVATMGGEGIDEVHGLAALPDGSSYVAGRFQHEAAFGEGEAEETVLSSHGHWDMFVARFNPGGQLVWARSAGGPDSESARGAALLADGSALVTGVFEGTAVFGEGTTGEVELTSEQGSRDAYAAKYSPVGDLCWARRVVTGPQDEDYNFCDGAAFPDGSFVVAGNYKGTVVVGEGDANETVLEPMDSNSESTFVARFGPDEALEWVADLAGVSDDEGDPAASWLWDIEPNAEGGCIVSGGFRGIMVVGAGEQGEIVLEAGADSELFVVRLDATGKLVWAVSADGADDPGSSAAIDLARAPSGLLAVAGKYDGELSLGSGDGIIDLPDGDDDAIFAALDGETGEPSWAFVAGGWHVDTARGVATWEDESLFYCGGFTGEVTFGTSATDAVTLTSVAPNYYYPDIFLLRLDRTDPPN